MIQNIYSILFLIGLGLLLLEIVLKINHPLTVVSKIFLVLGIILIVADPFLYIYFGIK